MEAMQEGVSPRNAAPAVADSAAADRAAWIDILSEQLLEVLPVEVWRKLFLHTGCDAVRFARENTTLLCCEAPAPDWQEFDVRTLAARFGGMVELYAERVVIAFARPHAALEVALLLQRTCSRRLRCTLHTAPGVSAFFEVDGEPRRLTLGEAHEAVRTAVAGSPPGSVHLCGATWRAIGPAALERHAHRALVTTEYHGEVVVSAFITPPPPPRAALSTFAGLGLV